MIKPEYKNITGLCYCVNFQWFSLSKNVFPQLLFFYTLNKEA